MGFEQKRNLVIKKIHLGSSSANELVGERNCSCFYPRADPLQDDGTLVPPGGSQPQLQKQFPESRVLKPDLHIRKSQSNFSALPGNRPVCTNRAKRNKASGMRLCWRL